MLVHFRMIADHVWVLPSHLIGKFSFPRAVFVDALFMKSVRPRCSGHVVTNMSPGRLGWKNSVLARGRVLLNEGIEYRMWRAWRNRVAAAICIVFLRFDMSAFLSSLNLSSGFHLGVDTSWRSSSLTTQPKQASNPRLFVLVWWI